MPYDAEFIVDSLQEANREIDTLESCAVTRSIKTINRSIESLIKRDEEIQKEAEDAVDVLIKEAVADQLSDAKGTFKWWKILSVGSVYSLAVWRVLIVLINYENEGRYIESKQYLEAVQAAEIYKIKERELFLGNLEDLEALETKVDIMEELGTTNQSKDELLHIEIWNKIRELENDQKK